MATVLGLVQETQIGDVEHVEWMEIGRRVQYVSGPRTSCGCGAYGRRSSGNLGDEYISNLRVPQFAVFW